MVRKQPPVQEATVRNLDPKAVAEIIGMDVLTSRRLMAMPTDQGGIASSNFALDPKSKRQFWRCSMLDILAWQSDREVSAKSKPKRQSQQAPRAADQKPEFDILSGEYK